MSSYNCRIDVVALNCTRRLQGQYEYTLLHWEWLQQYHDAVALVSLPLRWLQLVNQHITRVHDTHPYSVYIVADVPS